MICVFDSGVWISAFRFGGTPLRALQTGYLHHRIAVCDQIVAEIHRVLGGKFGWTPRKIEDGLGDYLDEIISIAIPQTLHGVCRDSKDDMVIECAMLAGADYIISGDKDLTSLGSFEGILVLTPRQFLDLNPAI